MSGAFLAMVSGGFITTTRTYDTGSGTETVPAGATTCVIEGWGAGAEGVVLGNLSGTPGAYGGGGGGYFSKTVPVTSGQTFSYSVDPSNNHGSTTVTSASPSVSLTANSGRSSGVAFTAGGTATGGDTNTTGSNGQTQLSTGVTANGGSSPNGGASSATTGNVPGGGGGAIATSFTGIGSGTVYNGAAGRVKFTYT